MGKRKSSSSDSSAAKKKVKRPPTAYSLFLKSTSENNDNKESFSVFTKNCSALWAKMSDNDKQKYRDEAAKLKEMWEEQAEIKKPEPKKKRSPGPYILFCSEMRAKVKIENPDFSMTMISRELGILWNKLTPEQKTIYQQKANEEKEKKKKEEEKSSSGDQDVLMAIEEKVESLVVEGKVQNVVVEGKVQNVVVGGKVQNVVVEGKAENLAAEKKLENLVVDEKQKPKKKKGKIGKVALKTTAAVTA